MEIKSVLKPEGSVVSGIAVAGSVIGIYALGLGTVAQAHASDANHISLESSRKKVAITSFIFVSTVTLLTRDANVGILGYGTMIAADIHFRHAIMANPDTGAVEAPGETAYLPAANVTPIRQQGYAVGV
jgi:hypothetical protein